MNNLVIVQQPKPLYVQESLVEKVINHYEIDNAFKHLQKGFESYEVISKLYNVVEKTKDFSTGLESSVSLTLNSYKDIVGDHSPNIAFENYDSPRVKRTVALEGIGSFLKSIWDAIVNFFKKIWNWITGKGKGGDSSTSKNIEKKKEEDKQKDKKNVEIILEIKNTEKSNKQKERQENFVKKLNEDKIKETYKNNYLKLSPFKTYDDFFLNGEDIISLLNKLNKEKINNLSLLFALLKDNNKTNKGPLELLALEKMQLGYNLGKLPSAINNEDGEGRVPVAASLTKHHYSNEYITYSYFDLQKHHSTVKNDKVDEFLRGYSLLPALGYYSEVISGNKSKEWDKSGQLNEHALFSDYSINQKKLEGILDRFLSISKDNEKIEEEFEKEIKILSSEAQKILNEEIESEGAIDNRAKSILVKFLMLETKALKMSIFQINNLIKKYTDIYMDLKDNGRFIEQLEIAKKLNLQNGN